MLHTSKTRALKAFPPETDASRSYSGVRRGQFGVAEWGGASDPAAAEQEFRLTESLWKCQVNLHPDFKHKANRRRQALNAFQTSAPPSDVTKQRTFKTCFFSA